jgi:Uma2 family endonuclease
MQLPVEFEKVSRSPLTDEQFLSLCIRYPDCRIETTAGGDIIMLPPAHPRTGQRNAAITYQLFVWTEQDGRGEAFDSQRGLFLD